MLVALSAAAVLSIGALVGSMRAAAPGAPGTSVRAARSQPSTPASESRSAVAPKGPTPPAQHTISQGSLPQTHAYPSGRTREFRALMASLWEGIVRGAVAPALPAFFPKGAYEQLKAIYGAGSDWTNRLVHDYRLDLEAAHSLLGRDAPRAHLLGVDVSASYGHWVPPGVCYNSVGYYEMPNARIVYSSGGRIRSLGIASMISWRGVWYVVHLGAILRPSDSGQVDSPEPGRGSSQYSGTC